MASKAANPLSASIKSHYITSSSIALSGVNLSPKIFILFLLSVTCSASIAEASSLTTVLAVVTNFLFLTKSSSISSKPMLDFSSRLPSTALYSKLSVTFAREVNTTSQDNSTPSSSNSVLDAFSKTIETETVNNLNTTLVPSFASRLSSWSIIVLVLGSVALMSLIGLILLLLRRRKKKMKPVYSSQTYQRSGLHFEQPPTSFEPMKQRKDTWRGSSVQFKDVIREIKYKLGNNRSHLIQKKKSKHRKIDLDRGNSQFLENSSSSKSYKQNSPAANFWVKSPRSTTGWSIWHEDEIWSPKTSDNRSSRTVDIGTSVERQFEPEDQHDLGSFFKADGFDHHGHRKPDQAYLKGKRLPSIGSKGNLPPFHESSSVISKFSDAEPKIDRRSSQIRVSQTITQYHSENHSSKTHIGSLSPSIIPSTYDGNRDSVSSYISSSTFECNSKIRSDQFDLDSPDLWRIRNR